MPRLLLWSLLPLLSTLAAPGATQTAEEPDPEKTLSPFFFVRSDDPAIDRLPLLSTSADVTIAGVIADVIVTQTYKNDGTRPIEALYVFPASTRAAVYGMKMTIEDRVVVAEIREREQARQEYEAAKQEGKSASLLEQQRPNVFQMNVANIMPGDTIVIELRYTELLVPRDGVYEFVYPTVVGPRYSNKNAANAPPAERWVASPYQHEGEAPLSTFGMRVRLAAGLPIQEIVCPSHQTSTDYDGPSSATVELAPEEANGGNRDFILRYRLDGGRIETGLLLAPGSDESFFLLMVQPPRRVEPDDVPPREYVFIMDVSGSMQGFPVETSKTLLRNLLTRLRPVDAFNVLFFSGGNWLLSPQSLPATQENIADALGKINSQAGGGGTELLPALRTALGLPRAEETSRTIVIATDGFVHVEAEAFDLIRDDLGDANLFAFGIGSSVNRHLIEGLAHVGMGEPFVVTKPQDAAAAAGRFLRYVESPVLTRVRVGYETLDAYDVEPKAVPDVLAQRPVVLFGKWRGPAQGTVTVTGRTAAGPFHQRVDLASARTSPWGSALRYLWARHRIRVLADYGALPAPGAEPGLPADSRAAQRIHEVTQLGLKYNLLTPYTSFVAVDQVVRSDGQPDKVQQPNPMPQGVTDRAVAISGTTGGSRAEVVTVAAVGAPAYGSALYASSGEVSTVHERAVTQEIALRGDRSWQGLLPLVPGATLPVSSSIAPLLALPGTASHMDGQSRLTGAFEIDGVDAGWGAGGVPALIPALDGVEEVNVRTGTLDAHLGHAAGALARMPLKSGSNQLHGSARALVNSEAASATEYFSHLRPRTRFAQLGLTVSGPIVTDKLFFFTAYQHTRDDQGQVYRLALPTQAFRQGDFSAADTTVHDPATGAADGTGRQPFPGNQVPADRVSPIASRILSLLPLPQRTDSALGQVNYETTGTRTSRTHALDAKTSWSPSDKDHLSATLSLARPRGNAPALADYGGPLNAGIAGGARQLAVSAGLSHSRTWTPTLQMEAQLGWSHYDAHAAAPAFGPGLADRLGIPGGSAADIASVPSIGIAGYSAPLVGFAGDLPDDRSLRIFQAGVKATKIWGAHLSRAGGDTRRGRETVLAGRREAGPRGAFRFGPLQTASATDAASQSGLANAFASFLLDGPDTIERSLPARAIGTRRSELALFVEDEWRLTRKLTLSFGLRHEYYSAPVGLDSLGGLSSYDPATNTLRVAGYGTVPANLGAKGSHRWLPRATASWQLSKSTVVRGSYGIEALPPVATFYGANLPLVQNDQIVKTGVFLPAGRMASGLPAVITSEVPASGLLAASSPALLTQRYFAVPSDPAEGRQQTWHVGVQQHLPLQIDVGATYVGRRGTDVPVLRDLNAGTLLGAGDAGRPQLAAFGRRASTLTWWPSHTAYDALQTTLSRRAEMLWVMATYTLGRSRDHASENGTLSTPADPERSWGRAAFDRRHAFAASVIFKPGDPTHAAKWLRVLLSDWLLSGFLVAQSGTPVDITAPSALLDAPGNVQRPDMSARPAILGGIGPGQRYFDTSVFSMPAAATWGNLSRNAAVDGPGIARLDFALAKTVRLGGSARLELRAECFNVTNTPQLVNPSGELGTATFGQITEALPGSQRSLRFGAHVSF